MSHHRNVAIIAGTLEPPAPGRYCNRRRKLVVFVHPDTGSIVGVVENRYTHPPKYFEADDGEGGRVTVRLAGIEKSWEDIRPGFTLYTEEIESRPLIPVAIVDCDGSSKLSAARIGPRDGLPPECALEVCCEVSADDTDPHMVPNTSRSRSKRAELLEKGAAQGFPMGRPHHPLRDHRRIHCIGPMVRRPSAERIAEAREWEAEALEKFEAAVQRAGNIKMAMLPASDTLANVARDPEAEIKRLGRIAKLEKNRAAKLRNFINEMEAKGE